MKRLMKWAYVLALPVLAGSMLASCEKDDDNNNSGGSSNNPTVVLDDANGNITGDVVVEGGSTLTFDIVAAQNTNSGKKIERLEITRTANNESITVVDSSFNDAVVNFTYEDTARTADGSEKFKFTVTDKDGRTASKTVTVTTMTITLVSRMGNFNHMGGACRGAFDLVNVAELSSGAADSNKDMVNTDQAGNDFTGTWESANGTLFRDATNAVPAFTYDSTATEADIEASFTAATIPFVYPAAAETVDAPEAGTVYLVQLGVSGRYAAIRVIENDPDVNTCDGGTSTGNTGELTFEYLIPNDVVAGN